MRDPYEVLGVQKNASPAAIKSAFRQLAKKLHPDANKNDKKAAAKFAELNAAYEIVGDEDKRKAFDRGEIDAEGKPRFQGFEGRGGPRRPGGGFGAGRAVSKPSPGVRTAFSARGRRGGRRRLWRRRHRRHSEGDVRRRGRAAASPALAIRAGRLRPAARGQDVTGIGRPSRCRRPRTGTSRRVHLPTGKEIDVKIPAGLADGQTIRLKGQGLPGPGGAAGDALITVHIAPHPLFERDGANLRLELPITLYEAVLGGKVRVPTLDGAVELAIPAGTSSGRTFRLKGKGLPAKDGAGDLYATVRIVLPERSRRRARGADAQVARREALRSAPRYELIGRAALPARGRLSSCS